MKKKYYFCEKYFTTKGCCGIRYEAVATKKNKGMKTNKSLTICQLFGGGNFEPSRLTRTIHAYFSYAKGRLSSFITAVAVVLFVFSVPVLTSCSSDTDDGTEAVDYQSLLSAQEWEVTEACQSFGGF